MARRSATVSGARKQRGRKVASTAARKPRRKSESVAELRAQMTAASRVLELIAKSPSDLQPVFDAIAQSARELTGATYCSVARLEDGLVKIAANCGWKDDALAAINRNYPRPVGRDNPLAVAILDGEVQNVADILDSDANYTRGLQAVSGYRSMLVVPIMRDLSPAGAICIFSQKIGVFQQRHIDLLKSFAAQAVIAIENTRLFHETQEALQQQTATAELLQIISDSPGELQPVFEAVLQKATRICDARFGSLLRFDGNSFYFAADVGTPEALREYMRRPGPFQGLPGGMIDRIHRTRQVQHSADYAAEAAPGLAAKLGGARSTLGVPILAEDELVGAIVIYRQEVRPFSDREIELVRSFASQAAIAIENARLFNETKEALERQTATADILKVIASSPSDVAPVFEAIASSANRLLGGFSTAVYRFLDGEMAHLAAFTPTTPAADDILNKAFPRPINDFPQFELTRSGKAVQIPDVEQETDAEIRHIGSARGFRSMLAVPLISQDNAIGLVTITRKAPGLFAEHHVQLLQTFADQAVIAIENTRLFNEVQAKTRDLEESLQQQTATADVLRIISRSVAHAAPVFDTILESCQRLFKPYDTAVYLVEGDSVRGVARRGTGEGEWGTDTMPLEGSSTGMAIAQRRPLHFPDLADKADLPEDKRTRLREIGGMTVLYAPMISHDSGIGSLVVTRQPKKPFTAAEIGLIQTFADQAVIAIENARLFEEVQARTRDLSETLEQQTATSEVLAVISRSPSDLNPVLEAISDTAARLCGSEQTMFFRYDGAVFRILASWNFPPEVHEMLERRPLMPGHPSAIGRAGASLKPVCIPDVLADPSYGLTGEQSRARYRATLAVPLLRDGRLIGALSLNRSQPGAFTEKQIELVTTFADQAVIAIENARLFNETKEALERQTATSDILRVISQSPTDVQPVFEAIAQTAVRLLGCDRAFIQRCNETSFWTVSWCGPDGQMPILNSSPVPIDPAANFPSRAIVAKKTLHLPDWSAIELPEFERAIQDRLGIRSALYLPLLRQGECIGLLAMAGTRANAFAAKDILLAESFRDQALIAIENARLFDEVQAKTRDLTEALAYQTGSGNVLKVIASSPTDINPVLEAIVESARELCESDDAVALLKEGESLRFSAHAGPIALRVGKRPISRNWTAGRAFVDQTPVHVHDMLSDEGAEFPDAREMGQATGASVRTVLSVPLLRGNESIGAILLRRTEVRPFKDKQIELLSTFADQAVIAIQNARLFNETREALERQTATSDILNVIASSPTDTRPVFEAIAARAKDLVGGFSSTVFRFIDGQAHLEAFTPTTPEADDVLTSTFPMPAADFAPFLMAQSGEVTQIADIEAMTDQIKDIARARGFRSMLFAPLMNKGVSIGLIVVTRVEPGRFADNHVQLLRTFADQAVIAIENVRLFDEVQARTQELSKSLEDLRTAQDRLVQTEKLASLGQLTAGIAHEIKNPLNFVNNFSALSTELTDELREVLAGESLTEPGREQVDELTGLLKDNLGKVVQHGKRADSIVKNMLLHSREGSGERRSQDLNALVSESLNLAYHGARAERSDFNITLEQDLDPDAGAVEMYPQDITRALLNLFSNGFYAAISRKKAANGATFEPVLSAATRNAGNTVEIRIRDNGTGIPAEIREKIFNPFFTTKPTGEGTGLGLSMTHDIIVKQHGGRIDIRTEAGAFTEFTITLPRANGGAKHT
ncbi:GAF domain-containing protein [Bradyrhizobium manausense]|uniref:GAF domain-containing protein n=1 Tax=Bradyrhizobium manausense TaxID=989370 RepID=UPI001BA79F9B|nr:GAF domain-containing protein [Bradyrhizobium manausense]MBR1087287.1 GAF domain-containing protein [Bradyrhizobium manausense]